MEWNRFNIAGELALALSVPARLMPMAKAMGLPDGVIRDSDREDAARIRDAHKFLLTNSGLMRDVAADYGRQLLAFGLAQLPFDMCVFQYGAQDDETGEIVRTLMIGWQDAHHLYCRHYFMREDDSLSRPTFTVTLPRLADFQEWSAGNVADMVFTDLDGPNGVDDAQMRELARFGGDQLLGAIGCLNADGIVQTEQKEPKFTNKQRAAKGKPPLFGYTLVDIDTSAIKMPGMRGAGGSHASPRLHWRRGHVRRYASGKISMVRPCLVGDKARGMIEHDYLVH